MSALRCLRTLRSAALFAALLFSGAFSGWAAVDDGLNAAIDRGVDFLISRQRADGRIVERDQHETAMTAMAILAMKAAGHEPGDATKAGEACRKALAFVLRDDRVDPAGYFGKKDGSRMYGHGITTLMLAEMMGMSVDGEQDALVRERCARGIVLILRAQNVNKDERQRGGWRYFPDARDSDLSVTVWQLMALRSAKNAGMEVPKEAIDLAVGYIKRSFKPSGVSRRAGNEGGAETGRFTYQVGGGHEGLSTTAEGVLALQVCGEYEAGETLAAAQWLMENPPHRGEKWFFYGTYYYAQGMNQRGDEFQKDGRQRVADVLLPMQERDGSWVPRDNSEKQGTNIYSTSLAILSLAVKYHYLPIYQR